MNSDLIAQQEARMRQLSSMGRYLDATRIPDEMLAAGPPAMLLRRKAIAFFQQGDIRQYLLCATEASRAATSDGDRLLARISIIEGTLYTDFKVAAAIEAATVALSEARTADYASVLEAKLIHFRLMMVAAVYGELPFEQVETMNSGLPELAQQFYDLGHLDTAFYALRLRAQRLPVLEEAKVAFNSLIAISLKCDRPADAGSALVAFAHRLVQDRQFDSTALGTCLGQAEDIFTQIGHAHGRIDVHYLRTKIQFQIHGTGLEDLERCLYDYEAVDFYRGMLIVLEDLSTLTLNDLVSFQKFNARAGSLAERLGNRLAYHGNAQKVIHVLSGQYAHGRIAQICQAALDETLPSLLRGFYLQHLGTAYAAISVHAKALSLYDQAIMAFRECGNATAESDLIPQYVTIATAHGDERVFRSAEALLVEWQAKDEVRRDWPRLANKLLVSASLAINRLKYEHRLIEQKCAQDAAEQACERVAETLNRCGMDRDTLNGRATLMQHRAQLLAVLEDHDGVVVATKKAKRLFESAGNGIFASNCSHMLGCCYLNRVNQALVPNFEYSERHLLQAINCYTDAGMHSQAINSTYYLAALYQNTATLIDDHDWQNVLYEASLERLGAAHARCDAMRQDLHWGDSPSEVHERKLGLVKQSQRITELALQITCFRRPNDETAWEWAGNAKARALSDILRSAPDDMRERSPVGTGIPAKQSQGSWLPSGSVLFDWTAVEGTFVLFVFRQGFPPVRASVPISPEYVETFASVYLTRRSLRHTLRNTPGRLRHLDPLIAAIADHSDPDELIILSPTSPLHLIPLHALEIGGRALLERNPIVYAPSRAVLRSCLDRVTTESQNLKQWAIFGDPSSDREAANEVSQWLGTQASRTPFVGERATLENFEKSCRGRSVIHFQGHCVDDADSPLDSHLQFANGRLTAREIYGLSGINADLVTLAACESANHTVYPGNEPVGLIPAFLCAGARSMLASQWELRDEPAAAIMAAFYERYTNGLGKAEALRQAALEVRDTEEWSSPFHWASFVLYGDWK